VGVRILATEATKPEAAKPAAAAVTIPDVGRAPTAEEARWSGVIADLTKKKQAAEAHLEQLREHKRALRLEAGMGSGDAQKLLNKLNGDLHRDALALDDIQGSIQDAEKKLAEARQAAAADAEHKRQSNMRRIANRAIKAASQYSSELKSACEAAQTAKAEVHNMLQLARPEERATLDRLLRVGPFMRGAQSCGLRQHLDFMGYPGLAADVRPLESEFMANLEPFLNGNGDGKE
jgi:hypothetical protein